MQTKRLAMAWAYAALWAGAALGLNVDNLTVTNNLTQSSAAGKTTFAGKVAINYSWPMYPLLVRSTGSNTVPVRVDGSRGNPLLELAEDANNQAALVLYDRNSEPKVRLDSAGVSYIAGGNLAVGSTYAAERVEIRSAGNNTKPLCIDSSGAWNMAYVSQNAAGAGELWLCSAQQTPKVRLSAAGADSYLCGGNLGIGTNAPAAKLHVAGDARFDQGVTYLAPLGDIPMGSFTNGP